MLPLPGETRRYSVAIATVGTLCCHDNTEDILLLWKLQSLNQIILDSQYTDLFYTHTAVNAAKKS